MLSRECWRTIGGMRSAHLWALRVGIDLDLALRARKDGYGVYTTEMAYINHFGRATGNARFGRLRYDWGGNFAMVRAMWKLYGYSATWAIIRGVKTAHDGSSIL